MNVDSAYQQEIERWHAGRIARLTAPQGWLSLVGLEWLKPGANRIGSASEKALMIFSQSRVVETGNRVTN